MATVSEAMILEIGADIKGIKKSMRDMQDTVKGATGKSGESFKKLARTVGGLAAAFGGLAVLRGIGGMFLNVNRETERMHQSLVTVTGSTRNANAAMMGLRDFARETPAQLGEVVQGFVKLKALGLDPSKEALRSYGNTAAAMGKSLNDFIEAVADATTNEFERLKEFGIKAKSEGENVTFTFQGVSTTVKKNADDINRFLQSIGENQFAGAMANQMDTMNGIISNIKDNVENLLVFVGVEGGINEGVKAILRSIRDWTSSVASNKDAIMRWVDIGKQAVSIIGSAAIGFVTAKVAVTAYTASMAAATTATAAFRTGLQVLMGSTGIGLIAVGVGILAQFLIPWDKLMGTKTDMEKLADETKNFNKEIKKLTGGEQIKAMQEQVGMLRWRIRELRKELASGELSPAQAFGKKDEILEMERTIRDLVFAMKEVPTDQPPPALFLPEALENITAIKDAMIELPTPIEAVAAGSHKIAKDAHEWAEQNGITLMSAEEIKQAFLEIEQKQREINEQQEQNNNGTRDWTFALEEAARMSQRISTGMGNAVGQILAGKAALEDFWKVLLRIAAKQALIFAINALSGGTAGPVTGFFKGIVGGLFKHGGTVPRAQHGMTVPTDPRGSTGVPAILHPGERVLTRRDAELIFGDQSPSASATSGGIGGKLEFNINIEGGGSNLTPDNIRETVREEIVPVLVDLKRKRRV